MMAGLAGVDCRLLILVHRDGAQCFRYLVWEEGMVLEMSPLRKPSLVPERGCCTVGDGARPEPSSWRRVGAHRGVIALRGLAVIAMKVVRISVSAISGGCGDVANTVGSGGTREGNQ